MIRLRAHHISNIAHSLHSHYSDFDELYKEYRRSFVAYLKKIHRSVIENPALLIQVVRGMDDICRNLNPSCPIRNKSCEAHDYARDIFCEIAYPLMVGRIYSAAEIIEIIQDFKKNTGLNYPEER